MHTNVYELVFGNEDDYILFKNYGGHIEYLSQGFEIFIYLI